MVESDLTTYLQERVGEHLRGVVRYHPVRWFEEVSIMQFPAGNNRDIVVSLEREAIQLCGHSI